MVSNQHHGTYFRKLNCVFILKRLKFFYCLCVFLYDCYHKLPENVCFFLFLFCASPRDSAPKQSQNQKGEQKRKIRKQRTDEQVYDHHEWPVHYIFGRKFLFIWKVSFFLLLDFSAFHCCSYSLFYPFEGTLKAWSLLLPLCWYRGTFFLLLFTYFLLRLHNLFVYPGNRLLKTSKNKNIEMYLYKHLGILHYIWYVCFQFRFADEQTI